MREESAVLLHVTHLSAKENRRLGANVLLSHSHFTTLRLDQAIETAEKGGFSRAAFTDQRYGFPHWNVDTHIVEGYHTPEAMRDIPRGQRSRHGLKSASGATQPLLPRSMWIPHRVFFGNVAFVAAVAIGVLLLAWGPLDRRRVAAAVLAPSAVAGAFQGFILTSGIPPTLWQRIGVGLLACTMISVWLLAAAGTIGGLRHLGTSRVFQALGGGAVAAIVLMLTRVVLG
jgi:hypothetical protein